MTTPGESSPSTDPAWLSTWQPEDPVAVAAAKAAQEDAGLERGRILRTHHVVGGMPLVVIGVLLLTLSGPAWLLPAGVACLVAAFVVLPLITLLRLRRVGQPLAERGGS